MPNSVRIRRGAKANLPTLSVGELGYATDTQELFIGTAGGNVQLSVTGVNAHTHIGGQGALITEGALSLSDVTTGNVNSTRHGFCPKAPNLTTHFLRGDATWATPTATATINLESLCNLFLRIDNTHYWSCGIQTPTVTTLAITAQRCYLIPFTLPEDITVSAFAIQVTTAGAAGTFVNAGIYNSSTGINKRPTTLLHSFGTFDTAATGVPTVSGSWALSKGVVYWAALVGSGTPTLRAAALTVGFITSVLLSGTTCTLHSSYFYGLGGTTLANDISSVTLTANSAAMPLLFFRN